MHEIHRRQDKAYKDDYRPEMLAAGRSNRTWSGAKPASRDPDAFGPVAKLDATKCKAVRENMIRKIKDWFYVYGNLAYKHRQQLSEFASLNNLPSEDPQTLAEMQRLEMLYQSDLPLLVKEIKKGKVRPAKGMLRYFVEAYVEWAIPEAAKATYLSQKFPREYLKQLSVQSKDGAGENAAVT